MALVLADRVQETSTSPGGTGTLNLSGTAPAGFKTFSSGIGTGNSTYYCIFDTTAYDWEVGIGTYTSGSPGTLSRTTVLSNSAGTTSAINFTNGNTLNIFVTYPSEKSINYDANGVATIGSTLGYSDTGIIASFVSTESDYNQVIIQNKSTANTASANFNVSNESASDTANFAEFGINSTTFVGDSSFDLPGAAYLSSASTPLAIGTYTADAIHFITNANSNTTDAMTIYEDGSVTLGGLPASGIGNISCNNINLKFQQIATSGGTTTLTNASPYYTQFTGTSAQNLVLPDATTCLEGATFIFDNDSTQNVTIKDGAGTTFELLVPGGFHTFVLEDNSTVAGTWLRYSQVPSTVEWGTYSLSLGATVISGGTWQGGTVQVGYGGTGLTSLTSGGALYATSSSTMTSGTLPVTAGGTGQTSFSSGYIPYGNSSAALQSSSSLQFNGTYLVVGGTTPLSGATNPISAFSSTANNYVQTYTYNANSGTSASADFVAYGNNSTDAHGWADMGFTSSNYADAVYTVTGPGEAYLFGSAVSGAGATGNLVYATDSTGSANAHQWYVGGFTQAKGSWKMQLTSTGLQLANALAISYGGTGLTSIGAAGTVLTSNGTTASWSSTYAGTVTSVSGTSPVSVATGTTTPVISLSSGYGDTQNPYASKTANYFLAAPNGSAGAPTFRAIVAADIPTLNQNTTGTAGGLSGTPNITVGTVSGTTITASTQFSGPGTGLTGTAASLSIGGNAATATTATTATNQSGGTVAATTGTFSSNLLVSTGTAVDPSNVTGFAAGQITESTTGFSAPGIVIGSSSGQHGAVVYASNTMYFGSEDGSNNTMSTRMTLSSAGVLSATGGFSGSGASLTSLNASNLSSGTVATARLASGTASSSTYLRGDQTWASISVTPAQVSDQANTSTGYFGMPTGTTAQRPGTAAAGYTRYNSTETALEYYNGSTWRKVSNEGFTYAVDYLVVAGGGGGSSHGGGGAGGYLAGSTTLSSGTAYSITVGSGGSGSYPASAGSGTSSSGFSISATGGGGGGGGGNGGGIVGGSGGGASAAGAGTYAGAAGTPGQGNSGGSATSFPGAGNCGGGGGGQSASGGNGINSPRKGGDGGAGGNWQSLGTYYAGGGGGGCAIGGGLNSSGGTGGGGAGAGPSSTNGTAGTANTGGGGGGTQGNASYTGGSGGSGVVIVRYSGSQRGSGGTVTSAGGYTYHTFTTSGTYTA